MSTTYLNVPKDAVIPKYAKYTDLPATGNVGGDLAIVLDEDTLYVWDTTTLLWISIGGGTVALSVSDTNTLDLNLVAHDVNGNVRYQDTNSINISDDSSGLKADVIIQDTNTVDLTINASGLKGDLKYQDSTSINLSDDTNGLKAELLINDTNSVDLTLGASGLEAAVRSQDTNSIDFGVDGSGIKADIKLSAVAADVSNQKVTIDVQADGVRAQIPDSSINTAITKSDIVETTSSVLTITNGTNSILGSSDVTIEVDQSDTSNDGYLSSTDWNTFNNKEPALAKTNLTETTSAILTISNGTGAVIGASPVTIAVQQANTTNAGYLSNTDWNTFNGKANAADVDALELINTNTFEPTGFLSTTDGKPNTSSVITFTDTSPDRTLSLSVSSGSFDFYVKGVKFTKTTTQTCQITDVEGLHYIYFNSSGNLVETVTFVPALITENALVSTVYWNAVNNVNLMVSDERHQITMDGASHLLHHTTKGSDYVSGSALNSFTIGNGSLDAHAQFGVDAGAMRDEDLYHELDAVLVANGCPIFYQLGTTGTWRRVINAGFSVTTTGTGRLAWNEFVGGAWQLSEVTNNLYALCHIFSTNDPNQPYIAIVGQAVYSSAANARTGANTEIGNLITSGLPSVEFVPIGTVILQTNNTYANAVKSRIILTDTGTNYEDFRFSLVTSTIASASSHSSLSNLAANDHPQYLLKGTGGINETEFLIANNQSVAADVTGFLFANATVRSFTAQVSIFINADTELHELVIIHGMQLEADWVITSESTGEDSGIVFSIEADGQVQYTSQNLVGFVSGAMRFKAITTGVL